MTDATANIGLTSTNVEVTDAYRDYLRKYCKCESPICIAMHIARRGKNGTYQPLSSNELGGQARGVTAKKIGLSSTTFQRALVITTKGSEEPNDTVEAQKGVKPLLLITQERVDLRKFKKRLADLEKDLAKCDRKV